jgi:diaminohydroxyphosphoribosylaminopyrimidine deaminase / 5-amino-6-(5-phosphoribosylamino)uracil reductase
VMRRATGASETQPHAAIASEPAAMRRALELARRGLGTTSPNPIVGAVVLDRFGEPVGYGWHARAGGPHAEVAALAAADRRARRGTAVVTLEPCAHTGRTGPCTEALIDAGIARVVYAVADPLNGGGAAKLGAAGIDVSGGLLAEEAAEDNEAWLHAVRTGRPFVTWKYAATLDGRCAAADRSSRWITGPAARADVHRLRAEADAVLVGVGTALADDPQLTARDSATTRQPLRVVLDTEGRTPPGARVRDAAAETLILTAADVKRGPDGRLDLTAALHLLYDRGVRSVLLEGGPTLAGAFLAAAIIDKMIGYLAPALLGAGPTALGDAGVGSMSGIRRLTITDVSRLGDDVRLTAYPVEVA